MAKYTYLPTYLPKKHHNKLIGLLKINRQSHYQNYFNENNKNLRALWKEINEIIYSEKTHKTNSPSPIFVDNEAIKKHNTNGRALSPVFCFKVKTSQKAFHQLKRTFQIFQKKQTKSACLFNLPQLKR